MADHSEEDGMSRHVVSFFKLAMPVVFAAGLLSGQWTMELPANRKQLFLDDHVISKVRNLKRTLHQPVKHRGDPMVRPERPWEDLLVQTRNAPFWDAEAKLWKLYYKALASKDGNRHTSCLAVSRDGIRWEKPALNIVDWEGSRQNNLVTPYASESDWLPSAGRTDLLAHVLYDPLDIPARRYKGLFGIGRRQPAVSADGLHWNQLDVPPIPSRDASQLNYDELGRQFIATVKHEGPYGRSVYLTTSKDFANWTPPKMIFHADGTDQLRGRQRIAERLTDPRSVPLTINRPDEYNVDVYNMPVFPYEGIYIGMPMKFHQSGPTPVGKDGFHHVELVSSRDLHHWTPVADRAVFIPTSYQGPGVYDTGTIVPPTRPIMRDGEMWLYYSGIRKRFVPGNLQTGPDGKQRYVALPDSGAILLARMRLDGFVSLDAGDLEGSLVTMPMTLAGKCLFVNADASGGEVRAEILDADGRGALDPFRLDRCAPVRGDQTRGELRWKGAEDLSSLRDKPVRFRFVLKNASLYAFWVTD
jgi:hypothetical protein